LILLQLTIKVDHFFWGGPKRRGFKTRMAAEAELTRIKSDYDAGVFINPDKRTVGEYLDHYLRMTKDTVENNTLFG